MSSLAPVAFCVVTLYSVELNTLYGITPRVYLAKLIPQTEENEDSTTVDACYDCIA